MWSPLALVIEITAGLRWVEGRERMRARSAMPRSNATEALKEGKTTSLESSNAIRSFGSNKGSPTGCAVAISNRSIDCANSIYETEFR